MASQREKNWGWFSSAFQLPASNEPDAAVSSTNCRITEPRTDRRDYDFDEFFRRPGRGRRALRRAAIFFFRLLTKPPLRPFSRVASCLASLRTSPLTCPKLLRENSFLSVSSSTRPITLTSSPSSRYTARAILLSMLTALL